MGVRSWQRKSYLKRHSLAPKLLVALSIGATGGILELATLPTPGYSLFSAAPQTVSVPINVAQASLSINSQATTIGVPITNMVPGQTVTRALTLNNTGNVNYGSVSMSTQSGNSALITSGALEMAVSECAGAVTTSNGNATCSGATTVVSTTPIDTLSTKSPIALTSAASSGVACSWGVCTAGGTTTMLVSIELSPSAPQSVSGTNTSVDFSITAEGS